MEQQDNLLDIGMHAWDITEGEICLCVSEGEIYSSAELTS